MPRSLRDRAGVVSERTAAERCAATPRGEIELEGASGRRDTWEAAEAWNPVPVWRRLLDGWMAIAGRFGFVQTLVILALFYAVLIGPGWR